MTLKLPPLLAAIVALASCPFAPAASSPPGGTPNIVFLLADNLGYGEPGCYGGGILRGAATPRIDRLAAEGLRLLNFKVESQCTPSRSAIMTGRFSIRSGTMKVPRGGAPYGLTQWETTIAGHSPLKLFSPTARTDELGLDVSVQLGRGDAAGGA